MLNDDLALLNALRAGDTGVLGIFHDRYRAQFRQDLRKAYPECPRAEADDIFIEILLKLDEHVGRGGLQQLYDGGLPAWFAVSGKRLYVKRRRQAQKAVVVTDELPDPGSDDDDPFAGQERAELLRRVRAAMTRLGDPCSWLLTRFYLHAESPATIAENSNGRYGGRDVVKKERWRCMGRLRALLFKD